MVELYFHGVISKVTAGICISIYYIIYTCMICMIDIRIVFTRCSRVYFNRSSRFSEFSELINVVSVLPGQGLRKRNWWVVQRSFGLGGLDSKLCKHLPPWTMKAVYFDCCICWVSYDHTVLRACEKLLLAIQHREKLYQRHNDRKCYQWRCIVESLSLCSETADWTQVMTCQGCGPGPAEDCVFGEWEATNEILYSDNSFSGLQTSLPSRYVFHPLHIFALVTTSRSGLFRSLVAGLEGVQRYVRWWRTHVTALHCKHQVCSCFKYAALAKNSELCRNWKVADGRWERIDRLQAWIVPRRSRSIVQNAKNAGIPCSIPSANSDVLESWSLEVLDQIPIKTEAMVLWRRFQSAWESDLTI